MNLIIAFFRSLKSNFITCKLIHKEGGNFESLGILREIRNESFKIPCQVLNEILNNESKQNILTGVKKY